MAARPLAGRLTDRPLAAAVTAEVGGGSLPAATHYVSSAATNGYAVGADSGAGTTKAAPWASVTYAIATAPTGSVIEVNDGTYQSATFYNVSNKSLTIQARTPGAVTLQAADTQTRVINLALVATSRTLALINLTLDGRGNTTRGISLGGSTIALGVVAGLTIRNCTIKDCTTRYIEAPQQKSVNISIAGLSCQGTIGGRPIYIQDAQDGTVNITGITFASTMTTNGASGIEVNRATGSTGVAVSVSGVTGTLTASGVTTMNGIVARNVDNAVIQGNSLALAGSSNIAGALYRIYSDSATLSANNGVIRNNSGTHNGEGGYGALIGADGTGSGDNNQNDGLIENNSITANAAAANPIHGLMLGFGTGGTISGNTVTGAGHGVVVKKQGGASTVSGNTFSGFSADGLYAKGATGVTFSGNTLNVTVANANGTVRVGPDDVSLSNSTGIAFAGNVLNVNVNPPKVVEVLAASSATFTGNTYNINATLGTVPAPWGYQGTGYNTLAEWKAVEPTALP